MESWPQARVSALLRHPSSGPPAAIAAYGEGAVVVSFYQVSEFEKGTGMTDPVLSL